MPSSPDWRWIEDAMMDHLRTFGYGFDTNKYDDKLVSQTYGYPVNVTSLAQALALRLASWKDQP